MLAGTLTDGVAVITGAASGIGRAGVDYFRAAGMTVCAIDNSDEAPDNSEQSSDRKVHRFSADVADRAALQRVADAILEEFGPPTLLMNNAGIGGGGDALSNPDGWERIIAVNLMGVLHGVQAFVPEMIRAPNPSVVINTGSKQGITNPPGDTAYNVSKAGVKALTEGLAHTLRGLTGDRVTAHLLVPGFTWTGMTARRLASKPPGAWDASQVVERMMEGVRAGEFYILCEDNETSRADDVRRILWSAGDLVENRPALSRWHADWRAAFDAFKPG